MPLQKQLLQLGYVLVILTGDTPCHGHGLYSAVYAIDLMHNVKITCLFIVNGDRHLVRNIQEKIVPGHSERAFGIIKSLDLHEIILRDQHSALEVSNEDTSSSRTKTVPLPLIPSQLRVPSWVSSKGAPITSIKWVWNSCTRTPSTKSYLNPVSLMGQPVPNIMGLVLPLLRISEGRLYNIAFTFCS